jgi:acyl transferase domain-containing protein/acyl carrier protein
VSDLEPNDSLKGTAIIGMSGRFPGASNLGEFWRNLAGGVESITFFSDQDLIASGVNPALLKAPNFVKAGGALDSVEYFDAAFFGVSPREAELMDPQYRFFLETAWEALEDAGYNPDNYEGTIGIYSGMSMNQYLLNNLITNQELIASESPLQLRILNDKDFLSSLTAYKLNLKGPSITVQAACATSLVATSLAFQSLLNYQCDVALAGGVSIGSPSKNGYFLQEGVFSFDGHCRAFDAGAAGAVNGNGVGMVVLKRLEDAISDGDKIYAVIKSVAVNNDGSLKVGYTAPSVDGQAEVVALAQALAEVDPETITYIEAHGTGTPMGDPIEISSLTQVFRASTEKKRFCAIGSVKTNIGHLDAAAGVASLIKVALSLEKGLLPPSLHFKRPNPEIDFDQSPFYVNTQLSEWKSEGNPRRAGVSSFAVGGVNAHVIVEEAPPEEPSGPSRELQLFTLSAKTDLALEAATDNLIAHLRANPDQSLPDIAYTLQVGRSGFDYRRTLVCRSIDDAIATLETREPGRVFDSIQKGGDKGVAFMFPGLGNQYINMGLGLYQSEPKFREEVDRCCDILRPHLGLDLQDILYPGWRNGAANVTRTGSATVKPGFNLRKMIGREDKDEESSLRLTEAFYAQPLLFVIEYALAKLWMNWGIKPQAMIGYSIGEYVAACLAGVFSLEDALFLVANRAKQIQELPRGSMLAVPLGEPEARTVLNGNLSLAAVNGSAMCVIAGPTPDIGELERGLAARGLICKRLQTSHAFHSKMMEPIQDSFIELVSSIKTLPPEIPFLSNVTGAWITPAQATDPKYWATHMSHAVRFEEGVGELLREPDQVLLEVGPGQTLGAWAMQHSRYESRRGQVVFASLRHSYDEQSDTAFLFNTLGRLWLAGLQVDWKAFYADEKRHRVRLPTYPFERKRYWISPGDQAYRISAPQKDLDKRRNIESWFYVPSWRQSTPLVPIDAERLAGAAYCWIVFVDECGLASLLVERLRGLNQDVITVEPGERFERLASGAFRINPAERGDYESLLTELNLLGKSPGTIIHLWGISPTRHEGERIALSDRRQDLGFFSLLLLAQALGNQKPEISLHIGAVTNNVQAVTGEEELQPEKATVLGPIRVIPHEYQNITCQCIDIVLPERGSRQEARLTDNLLEELVNKSSESLVAYRGGNRWINSYEPLPLDGSDKGKSRLLEGGVYLITGGMGGIGLVLAEHMSRTMRVKLILTARSNFPAREDWADWLLAHSYHDAVSRKIRKLQEIESRGSEVLPLSADVTEIEQMRFALATAHERFGKINGVIHAAGVSPGGMIQVKEKKAAAAVLAPKVKGALVLNELLKDADTDFIIFCSSILSILGGIGMADHCAANAFLDAFARSNAQSSGALMLSINWDRWLEVGQAADAQLSLGLKEIVQESIYSEINHPLLEKYVVQQSGEEIYLSEFSTSKQWVLDEHRIMGYGVLPGTAYVEMITKAFEKHAGGGPVLIRQLTFINPLMVKDGDRCQVQTIVKRDAAGFVFQVLSKRHSASGEPMLQKHVQGRVDASDAEPPMKHDLAEIRSRCNEKEMVVDDVTGYSHNVEDGQKRKRLGFGRRWRNLLKKINIGQGEMLAYLELPEEFIKDLDVLKIHPALMDAATGIVQAVGEELFLPLGYEKLKIMSPLPRRIYSHFKAKEGGFTDQDIVVCDIVIVDEQGTEIIQAENYTLKKVRDIRALEQSAEGWPRENSLHDIAVEPHQEGSGVGAQTALQKLEGGIMPAEGAEAFGRILSSARRLPQLIVSTRDLQPLMEQLTTFTHARILEEMTRLQSRRRKHPRPNLSTELVAPRNDIESNLADIWKETLSVEEIGIHDNFFEVGGDSLLATQLISRLSETFNIDLSLRGLFQSPTIANLALIIVQKHAEQADDHILAEVLSEISQLSEDERRALLEQHAG